MMRPSLRSAVRSFSALLVLAAASEAQFQVAQSHLPTGSNNNSSTENVDFGDVDLDGDWDVVMADGGDDGNDQNRIWINLGNAQRGAIGFFDDQTSTRFPVLSDDSRDIEFVDFDSDGDLDIYVSNTAQLSNQGNHWWTNVGGKQGGAIGFYRDETASRWVGLGSAGSSIPASQLIGGTFIDFTCDCDFGDLDNDGDMDLVHSSYGRSLGGTTPTRIFLNDGDGHFQEFNPSGFQLSGENINSGNPGLWCDGRQTSNTTDTTGVACDIATSALDIDVGDIDGDFDLDILHGARDELPRMFANRLEGSSLAPAAGDGKLGFRDVTGAAFPSGYSTSLGHYEQEMGDLDGDDDLDIYGLNWRATSPFDFTDCTLSNDGDGTYSSVTLLSGSGADDNEGDFFDADNDGDLDLWVASFSANDKLYRNDNNGRTGFFSFTQISAPSFSGVSLDADCCDVDNDGDYDVLVAEDNFSANTFVENISQVPDTHAPRIPKVEVIGDQTAHAGSIPVRSHVYDNAPYYITWYNRTELLLNVDGCDLPPLLARSSGGQIFRAEIPGNLVGRVTYRFRSSGEYGNTGLSAETSYTATTGLSFANAYGTGTPGPAGVPTIEVPSVPYAGAPVYIVGKSATPNTLYVLWIGDAPVTPPVTLGQVTVLNAFGNILVSQIGRTDANGNAVLSGVLAPDIPPGIMGYCQFFTRNGTVLTWASSQGVALTTF